MGDLIYTSMCNFIGTRGAQCKHAPNQAFCKSHNKTLVDDLTIQNLRLREENARLKTGGDADDTDKITKLVLENEKLTTKYDQLMIIFNLMKQVHADTQH
jgi:hypothetical protein